MKNTLNNLFLAIFLAMISQGIQAQFDDIYYDPNRDQSATEKINTNTNTKEETYNQPENEGRIASDSYAYDDESASWEEQDYYYASRIKRFHRPYYGFDYYNSCYVDNFYYDPFDFDPFFYNRDIYVSSIGYNDYYRWRRWNSWNRYSYWNQWDVCFGYAPFTFNYSYAYWPYSNYYYNNNWSGYNSYHNGYNNGNWNNGNDNHPNGTHYGSRRFGLNNTSKRGPVRVVSASPRVLSETQGTAITPSRQNATPNKRVVRSADGDVLIPGPVRTERSGRIDPADRSSEPRVTPHKTQPDEMRPAPERSTDRPRKEENKGNFKPQRMQREEYVPDNSNNAAPRIEMQREKSRDNYQAPRESRPEPKIERRSESNDNSRSRSESSGSKSENKSGNDGGRRSPR
jgi:hypothetical protein